MAEHKATQEKNPASREIPGRSGISHPYFDLAASIAVAEAIHKTGGGTCRGEQLAPWLGYKSTSSGTYLTRVAAASKHFGLIEQRGDRFGVTERAKSILSPVMPSDGIEAMAEAFLSVSLFSKVYEQYKGRELPPAVGLRNLFENAYKLLTDRVPQAVRVFLNSAEQAGFFSTTGDRTRLVRPHNGGANSFEKTEPPDAPAPPEKSKPVGGSAGDAPNGVDTAIIGLLRKLPAPTENWSIRERQKFLDAFKTTIEFIYPASDEES